MFSTTTPIIKAELNDDDEYQLSKTFINNEENLHNGTTFIFKSEKNEVAKNKDKRYFQFKTIIEENNQDYFIYDEVIQVNGKPVLLLRIHNDEAKEIWEQIIYLEDDKVVEQIRHLTYEKFFGELKNNEKIIRSEEKSNTTIIRIPFLQFIGNINQEKNEFKQQKPIKKVWWKRLPWKMFGLVVFVVAWAAIPVIGNLLIVPLLVGVVSASVMTWLPFVTAGLITGCIVAGFNRYRARLKKLLFPKWKAKSEINLENKLIEQRMMLEKNYLKQLFLTATSEAKEERLLNGFQEIWNKNKVKSFAIIETELSEKIAKKEKEEIQQNLENIYKRKDELQIKAEANKANLSVEENEKIKNNFQMINYIANKINKEGQKAQYDKYDLKINQRVIVDFSDKIEEIIKKGDKSVNINSEKDIKKKSPVKSMKN